MSSGTVDSGNGKGRSVVAGIVGYLVWTAIWLGGGAGLQAAMPESVADDGRVEDRTALLLLLGLSVVCSLLAGVSATKLTRSGAGKVVMVMAIVLLLTGIGVQASVWDKMPQWYHLTFLLLIVPTCVLGGRLARR